MTFQNDLNPKKQLFKNSGKRKIRVEKDKCFNPVHIIIIFTSDWLVFHKYPNFCQTWIQIILECCSSIIFTEHFQKWKTQLRPWTLRVMAVWKSFSYYSPFVVIVSNDWILFYELLQWSWKNNTSCSSEQTI